MVKESTCQLRSHRRHEFHPWVGRIPWRRKGQPTPVFLAGESHGQKNLVGYSPWSHTESDTTEPLNNDLQPPPRWGWETSPEGQQTPRCSCSHTLDWLSGVETRPGHWHAKFFISFSWIYLSGLGFIGGDAGLIPGWGGSPGGGHGNPLQYSCLENPTDRGAWRAAVHRVTKSGTRLKWLSVLARI